MEKKSNNLTRVELDWGVMKIMPADSVFLLISLNISSAREWKFSYPYGVILLHSLYQQPFYQFKKKGPSCRLIAM